MDEEAATERALIEAEAAVRLHYRICPLCKYDAIPCRTGAALTGRLQRLTKDEPDATGVRVPKLP